MALFNFGKKKEETNTPCCCGSTQAPQQESCCCASTSEQKSCCAGASAACCPEAEHDICCIKVLGAGCIACHDMFEHTRKAAAAVGLSIEVEYVTDMEKVMSYGVMTMPVLVINEKVVAAGKVLKQSEIEALLK